MIALITVTCAPTKNPKNFHFSNFGRHCRTIEISYICNSILLEVGTSSSIPNAATSFRLSSGNFGKYDTNVRNIVPVLILGTCNWKCRWFSALVSRDSTSVCTWLRLWLTALKKSKEELTTHWRHINHFSRRKTRRPVLAQISCCVREASEFNCSLCP